MLSRKKLFFAGAVGNSIEVFESVVYAFLQPFIAKTFFPPNLRENNLLFLITVILPFIARPLGAIVFGVMGDLKGRKTVLELCMIISGISCALITILPSYDSIGISAFFGILWLRFLFGLAMSSEYNNSFLYLAEHSSPKSRGFILSWASFGVNFGIFSSALLAYILTQLTESHFIPEWSFRLLFLLSMISLYIGYVARKSLPETAEFYISYPTFEANKKKAVYTTVGSELTNMKLKALKVILLAGFGTHITYSLFLYGPFHLIKHNLKISSFQEASTFIILATFITSLLVPFFGKLSDKIGRRLLLLTSIPALSALYLFFFFNLTACTSYQGFLIFYSVLGIVGAPYFAVAPAEIIDSLPSKMRSTANGLLYSIPAILFGALSLPYFQIQFEKSALSALIILILAIPLFLFFFFSKKKLLKPTLQYNYSLEQAKVS
jgi:MFS transporter, MHS family, proline/betaine transporter